MDEGCSFSTSATVEVTMDVVVEIDAPIKFTGIRESWKATDGQSFKFFAIGKDYGVVRY
jgi:hypothetical protein